MIKRFVLLLAIVIGLGVIAPVGASAASVIAEQCQGVTDSKVCDNQNASSDNIVKNIINTLLFIVGAVSVVMIIVGGLMYTTSAGDSGRVTTAKNTITYAVVGLVVSALAFAIVQFVVTKFTT